jgi:large subunit ribosomal protein L29
MKASEARNLNSEELEDRLRELREELFNFQFRLVTQQIENPIRMRHIRREIARILTVVHERELAAKRAGGK